jgi:hypothetical protein
MSAQLQRERALQQPELEPFPPVAAPSWPAIALLRRNLAQQRMRHRYWDRQI